MFDYLSAITHSFTAFGQSGRSAMLRNLTESFPDMAAIGGADKLALPRAAASALLVAGLTEFIAEGTADYRQKLLLLLREPDRMSTARECLTTDAARQRLFNTESFMRNFEAVLNGLAERR